jgi:hypothetical protein
MGRRSRKRGGVLPPTAASEPAPERPRPRPQGRRPRHEERPKAPWHPVPLVELCALVGIILLVVGLFNFDQAQGRWMIAAGLALGSLAGLDTVLREHFSGYKSHSTVLGGLPAVAVAGALFFSRAPWGLLVAAMLGTFLVCFWLARRAFRKRAGVAFR